MVYMPWGSVAIALLIVADSRKLALVNQLIEKAPRYSPVLFAYYCLLLLNDNANVIKIILNIIKCNINKIVN